MYGPTDDKNIGFLIDFAKKLPCFPIPGHGKWPRQPIYIDDFTPNQVDSLTAKEVFPDYPWWEEFNIDITSFEDGVKKMVEFD